MYEFFTGTKRIDLVCQKWNILYKQKHPFENLGKNIVSNSADAQNISCLGLYGRDYCPDSYASYGLVNLNFQYKWMNI